MKRILAAALALAMAATLAGASADDTPYPVIGEPVLRPDTQWTGTDWGYAHASLNLEPAPPANHPEGWLWPTLFTMEGYAGATRPAPNAYLRMDDGELMALRITFNAGPRGDYALVQASIRGTECSGGHFNLYDRRHAYDAYQIIEWVAAQEWSNERVGMFGSSYPGQTAYWTASVQAPHLAAVSANLLHSDIYRDIFMPGGVQNILFPSLWTYGTGVVAGPHRVPIDAARNQVLLTDEICLQQNLARYGVGDLPHAENEPIWAGTRAVDDDWYVNHAAITYAPAIKIPFYLQNNWQDEQVGPRSVVLWHHIHPTPRTIVNSEGQEVTIEPKKFVLASGNHGHGGYAGRERWAWFDIWLLDMPDSTGLLDDRVVNYFEAEDDGSASATKSGDTWPFEDTSWEKIHLTETGGISFEGPGSSEAPRTYLSGVARQNYFEYSGTNGQEIATAQGLPDMLTYISEPLDGDLTIAGPILMELYAAMAGTDADFFVSISDVWPDGSVSYLQRGLLKASHRRVDPLRSYYDDGLLVQPYRPHTNPQPVMPGEIIKYDLEIFPLGHVFRAGHRLQVNIHTPPVTDGLWGYSPTHHQPAAVTVYHGSEYPTAIQLPVIEPDGPVGEGPGCQIPGGFPCYAPPVKLG